MPYAISYVRFSHPRQRLGDSLRRQVERTQEYCRKHGLMLNENLRDEGFSAHSGEHVQRGALGRLLERVRKKEIEPGTFLIVEALDRLSRQTALVALRQFMDILEQGLIVVTLIDGQRYDLETANRNPMTLSQSLNAMILANTESDNKADRGLEAWTEKRRKAREEGIAMTAACPAWLTPTEERQPDGTYYKVIAERAAIVRSLFEMVASANGGLMSVARRLNQGTPVLRGRKGASGSWSQSTIRYFIHSRAPEGVCWPHSGTGAARQPIGDPMEGHYPRIVDADLVARARNALADRRNAGAGRKGRGVPNLLTGIACCGMCNGSMGFVRGGRRSTPDYLMCYTANRGPHCPNRVHFNYGKIESTLLDEIGTFAFQPEVADSDPTRDLKIQLAEAQAKFEAAQARAARLAEALASDSDAAPLSVLALIRTSEREAKAHRDMTMRLAAEIASVQARTPSLERREAARRGIATLRRQDLSDDERYAARVRMQALLRDVLDFVVCDPDDRSATVITTGAMMTFKIERSGAVAGLGFHFGGQSLLRHPDGHLFGPMASPPEIVEWQNAVKARMASRMRRFTESFLAEVTDQSAST